MQRITISRYNPTNSIDLQCELAEDGKSARLVDITDHYSGVVEGERDDGTTWSMFIDAHGSPELFWSEQTPTSIDADGNVVGGGVIGEPILLQPDAIESATVTVTYDVE